MLKHSKFTGCCRTPHRYCQCCAVATLRRSWHVQDRRTVLTLLSVAAAPDHWHLHSVAALSWAVLCCCRGRAARIIQCGCFPLCYSMLLQIKHCQDPRGGHVSGRDRVLGFNGLKVKGLKVCVACVCVYTPWFNGLQIKGLKVCAMCMYSVCVVWSTPCGCMGKPF